MHFEPRLWQFTEGLRLRILGTTFIGLVAVGLGIARLALLGWLIGQIFAGHDLRSLALPILLIALVMIARPGRALARGRRPSHGGPGAEDLAPYDL